jgi:hypothetical protein
MRAWDAAKFLRLSLMKHRPFETAAAAIDS